jgi:hypothetical protein
MINIGIGIGWAKALYSVANNVIANFKARVLSYPNSIFEAGPCLDATLEELNAIGLLDNASLIITPNAYNEGILYDVVPNTTLGDMTVVRATTATRVNSAGLIEVVPRNLLTYSNTFNDASWLKSGVTITANTTIAPNGTTTASKIVENGSLVEYGVYKSIPLGFRYSHSIYAKKGERDWIKVNAIHGANASVWFNLANGTIGTNNSTGTPSIENVGNGWYRCAVNNTDHSFAASFYSVMPCTNNNIETYTGTVGNGIFIWGAQLENFATATEYFPTTTRLNIPRIDYTNGSCPSLLVEPQRTNLLTYSNTFSNAAWIKLNCSVASNSIISPDGTQNSTTLTSSVTNNNFLYNAITTANGLYTLSCFVKYLDTNTVNLSMTDFATGSASAEFNFNTGLFNTPIVSGSWTNTTTNVITLTNGWFKISITSQKNAGLSVSSRIDSFAVGKSVYIWGAQLELGAYATSYIPTVASSVTRNADVISKTGISSLIGQTEGTIFIDFNVNNLTSQTADPVIFSTSGTNYIRLFTTKVISYFESNTVSISSASNVIINGRNKIAVNYKNNDFSLYVNGVLVGSNNSGAVVAKSNFSLNYIPTSVFDPSLFYNSVQLYKTKLTNAESIQLTTL